MKLFITGIGTDVGKTIASAIITEALQADYWKPVQAGDLDNSDTMKVQRLVSNATTVFHPSAYALNTPASPHLSASLDHIRIEPTSITEPATDNHLVIEGAGGLYVPLNETQFVLDLIRPDHQVIVVSRHYLGSINHTLLTLEALRSRGLSVGGIIFNGDAMPSTEQAVLDHSGLPMLGRIDNEPYFDQNVVADYADRFRDALLELNRH